MVPANLECMTSSVFFGPFCKRILTNLKQLQKTAMFRYNISQYLQRSLKCYQFYIFCHAFSKVINVMGKLPFCFQFFNLFDRHSKDKNIFRSHFFSHLHIGTIKCSNCKCSIQLQKWKSLDKFYVNPPWPTVKGRDTPSTFFCEGSPLPFP